jgi:hypothetical protein
VKIQKVGVLGQQGSRRAFVIFLKKRNYVQILFLVESKKTCGPHRPSKGRLDASLIIF